MGVLPFFLGSWDSKAARHLDSLHSVNFGTQFLGVSGQVEVFERDELLKVRWLVGCEETLALELRP